MKNKSFTFALLLVFVAVVAGCASVKGARHEYLMKGQVLEVSGGQAYLCVGSASGAKEGQELDVFRYVPSSILGEKQRPSYRREKVGTVKITQVVDAHFANAQVLSGNVRANDVAEF